MHWPSRELSRGEARLRHFFMRGAHLADIVARARTGGGAAAASASASSSNASPCIARQCHPAGSYDRSPRRRCRSGSSGYGRWQCEALGGDLAEFAADDDQAIRRPRSDRWRYANSGRTARPTAGASRRSPPFPLIVWATGIDCASANAVSAPQASDRWMPPPVSINGRFALAIEPRSTLDISAIRANAARRRLQRRLVHDEILGREIVRAVCNVFGHVEQDRARPSGSRNGERASHQFRDCGRSSRRASVLSPRAGSISTCRTPGSCCSRNASDWCHR